MVALAGVTCTACGAYTARWSPRCPECHRPGTLRATPPRGDLPGIGTEIKGRADSPTPVPRLYVHTPSEATPLPPPPAVPARLEVPTSATVERSVPIPITQAQAQIQPRISTGMLSFDRVLGEEPDGAAGLVVGSVVLIGGDPGAGKSTILGQMMANIARRGHTVLYATGEESIGQATARARRTGALDERVYILRETDTAWIVHHAKQLTPAVLVIDSVQTLEGDGIGASGSTSALRDSGNLMSRFAKDTDTIVILIGHVTKDGQIAGPQSLAHAVDVTLLIEVGDYEESRYRYLRAFKNRFGNTSKRGAFEMTGEGMIDVDEAKARAHDEAELARLEAEAEAEAEAGAEAEADAAAEHADQIAAVIEADGSGGIS